MTNNVRSQLLSGERIVWEGKPYTGFVLRPIEVFLIPFSLVRGGFALFWNTSAWKTNADLSFKLFGLPFIIVGLYVIVGRFIVDIYIRNRTAYLVTNKRILIVRGAKRFKCKIARHKSSALPRTSRASERADGSGTIRFGASGSWFNGANSFGMWQPTFDPTPQFIRVPQVRSLYQLIQKQTDG